MRFVISLLNFRPGQIGGTETHLRHLLQALPEVAGEDQLTVLLHRDNADAIATPGIHRVVMRRGDKRFLAARLAEAFTPWRALSIERVFNRLAPDVALFPQQSIFPKAVKVPCVLTVVDLQHLFFPQYFNLLDTAFRATIYPKSLRKAAHVIAISQYTRKTLIDLCGMEPDRVTAVPHGAAGIDTSSIVPTDKFPRPYLYYPAATFPHKNHETLLRTFAAIKRGGNFPHKLVLTGKQTERWPALQQLIRGLGLEGEVLHPGFLPYGEVQRIYKGADAIVFPTQFEGFGLPVVEAADFGQKIITSRLEVFDEIGVPAANQIDFGEPDELAAALALPRPTRLLKKPMTWLENARQTLEILRRVGQRSR